MSSLEFIVTSDGSHTLRNTDLNETYHSIHGARQESLHVFIANGLAHFVAQHNPANVSLLEVGFGTGLNALLAWELALAKDVSINYDTIEPFPLRDEIWSRLNYADDVEAKARFSALHKAEWKEVALDAHFRLKKMQSTLWDTALHRSYDVIFFDAFAPSVQPDLWTLASLEKVVNLMNDGGVFVTYSARGQLKRDLKTLGLQVEVLPGPPGKNEMVRGVASKK